VLSTYSHSGLKTFRNCPRKFKFQYIEKPQIPKRIGAEAYLGNAVHRVLQTLYQRGHDGVVIPLEKAIELYSAEWKKIDLGKLEVVSDFMTPDDYIRLGRELLEAHYESYQPFKFGTLLGTEMFLSFTLPGTPFKLRGYVDRLWKRDDGVVEIVDYKTGRHLPRPQDLDYFYQMGLYQLAVMENHPQYEEIETVQTFLRLREEVRYRFSRGDLDKLVEDIRLAIMGTLHAEKFDDYPTVEGSLCNWCEYQPLCPAKRHKLIIEGEVESDDRDLNDRAAERATEYIEKNDEFKALKAELDALKEDLVRLSEQTGHEKFAARGGTVAVSRKTEEKFVTATESMGEFADLSALARELGLEDYFKLDGRALMKEIIKTGRLSAEQQKRFEPFARVRESVRVTVRKEKPKNDEAL